MSHICRFKKNILAIAALLCLALMCLNPAVRAADEDIEALFNLNLEDTEIGSVPQGMVPQDAALPFEAEAEVGGKTAYFVLKIERGSYIYRDSIRAEGAGVSHGAPTLPEAKMHKDYEGEREVYTDDFMVSVPVYDARAGDTLTLSYQGCDGAGICYPPQTISVTLPEIKAEFDPLNPPAEGISQSFSGSPVITLALCVLMGFGLCLTPCVLPMLSIYSAMIMGGGKKTFMKALSLNLAYLIGLVLTFTILGLVFSQAGVAAHAFLQNEIVLWCLAALMAVLALNCAGALSLKLPKCLNSLIENKLSSQKRGLLSSALIFGALSALLATPCTSAPLAGVLLYILQQGSIMAGTLMFMAVGLGMGLPLVLVGLFGQKLLPRPGYFSVLVRKIMAVPLVAGAFYIVQHLLEPYAAGIEVLLCLSGISYIIICLMMCLAKERLSYPKILLPILCCAILGAVGAHAYFDAPKKLEGFALMQNGQDLKSLEGGYALLTFSADWCHNCHEMDKDIYTEEDFLKASAHLPKIRFNLTEADSKENEDLAARFKLVGVPTAVLLGPQGEVVSQVIGLASKEQIMELIAKVPAALSDKPLQ